MTDPSESAVFTGSEEALLETTRVGEHTLDDGYSFPEEGTSNKQPERVYTVDDAIEKIGFGPFQILIAVFCGLMWVADAMELMLLSILSPIVKCQWDLSNLEEAMITSVVFFGIFLGGVFWGVLCDKIGRKKVLLIADIAILVFGVLSALKMSPGDSRYPGYPWLIICRFFVGFSAAGTSQGVVYYVEFLPLKGRGMCTTLVSIWWSIGTIFGALLAIGVLGYGDLGWHWYLGLAATPLTLVLFLFPFVPESARFYLIKGKRDQAHKVIERVAKMNFKKLPSGTLVSQEEKEKRNPIEYIVSQEEKAKRNTAEDTVVYREGSVSIRDHFSHVDVYAANADELVDDNIGDGELQHSIEKDVQTRDDSSTDNEASQLLGLDYAAPSSRLQRIFEQITPLFTNGMWRTTVILMILWFGCSFLYYGVVLLTTSLLRFDPHCGGFNNLSNSSSCEDNKLGTGDYIKIMWSAGAELPGLIITVLIIDFIGRKMTLAVEFLFCVVGFLLLFICASESVITFFLFIIRAFSSGVFKAIYVYTPEVYPTNSRALGLGVCSTASRVGGMITPVIAQVLFEVNDYATFSLYAGSCIVFTVLAILLPIETKGRTLRDGKSSKGRSY